MKRGTRLVDLSVSLAEHESEPVPVHVERFDHAAGGRHLSELVGIDQRLLPDGCAWASERITAITHAGTHVDAPFHYAPRCGDRPSRTVDQIPLDWFCGSGVCIDVRGSNEWAVGLHELAGHEQRTERAVAAGDIVLFLTGAATHYGTPAYLESGRWLDPRLVRELVGRGVRVIGTDAWSIDPPLSVMRRRIPSEGADAAWTAHFVGRDLEFCVVEKLCNLERLPPHGFSICCFPVKVAGGSAGWVRAVAFVEGTAHA
ncbi:MAG: cyclase family protein [Vicinamibacterales bacterium]